jgi:hypothetical protein
MDATKFGKGQGFFPDFFFKNKFCIDASWPVYVFFLKKMPRPTQHTTIKKEGQKGRKRSMKKTNKKQGKQSKKKSIKKAIPQDGKQSKKKPTIQKHHWRDVTPMTKSERSKMPPHCLLDPEDLKYPVCKKNSEQISCEGLSAAKKRATLQRNEIIVYKASRLQKAIGCEK